MLKLGAAGLVVLQGPLVRVHIYVTVLAVHGNGIAVLDGIRRAGHAQHRGDLQRAGQNGGMAGAAADLGDDAHHVLPADAHGHAGGEVLGNDHGAGGGMGQVHIRQTQQLLEQTGAQVTDVGGALAHQLVLHAAEHGDEGLANGIHRSLGHVARSDLLLHLAHHKRVVQHHDLAGQNLGGVLAHLLGHLGRHGAQPLAHSGGSRLQALGLLLLTRELHRGIIQILLFYHQRMANAHTGGRSCTL